MSNYDHLLGPKRRSMGLDKVRGWWAAVNENRRSREKLHREMEIEQARKEAERERLQAAFPDILFPPISIFDD